MQAGGPESGPLAALERAGQGRGTCHPRNEQQKQEDSRGSVARQAAAQVTSRLGKRPRLEH